METKEQPTRMVKTRSLGVLEVKGGKYFLNEGKYQLSQN